MFKGYYAINTAKRPTVLTAINSSSGELDAMGKAAVSCTHVAKSILCVPLLTSLQKHLLAPGMNLPHVVLDFMSIGHVGAQPCRTLC